jgi:hypothetical protein
MHSNEYKSTMDWCSVYLTPQALPKYIYLSPPLIFPTTSNGTRTKNRPVWITLGAAPLRWMGPIRNPRWSKSGLRVTLSYLGRCQPVVVKSSKIPRYNEIRHIRDPSFSVLDFYHISNFYKPLCGMFCLWLSNYWTGLIIIDSDTDTDTDS